MTEKFQIGDRVTFTDHDYFGDSPVNVGYVTDLPAGAGTMYEIQFAGTTWYRFECEMTKVEEAKPVGHVVTFDPDGPPVAPPAPRKAYPLATGCLDYFPDALMAVALLSKLGNDKHNPGEPLHHARGKSMDHADCILRHLKDRGTVDPETDLSHSVAVAWRALALLQEELEAAGAPRARGAK